MYNSDIILEELRQQLFGDSLLGEVTGISLSDVGEGSKRVDVKYSGKTKIYLYAPCSSSDIERIKSDKSILSAFKYYESRNTAEAFTSGVQRSDHILEIILDTSGCLDLLNLYELNQIKLFYEAGIKAKAFQKGIEENDLLVRYIRSQNGRIRSMRYIDSLDEKVCSKSKLTIPRYIVYKVIDIKTISGLSQVK